MKKLFSLLIVLAAIGLVLGGCSSSTDPADSSADL